MKSERNEYPELEINIREFLAMLGEDVDREGLVKTPNRVARMWQDELLAGMGVDVQALVEGAIFSELDSTPEGDDGMVIVKNIPFYSVCEHHLVPFHGVAHVGYISKEGRVVGLSKIARVLDAISRRPQVQERITNQVAAALHDSSLKPEGTGVVIEAEHMCMAMRGVQKPGTTTITSAMLGSFRHEIETRNEFLTLIKR